MKTKKAIRKLSLGLSLPKLSLGLSLPKLSLGLSLPLNTKDQDQDQVEKHPSAQKRAIHKLSLGLNLPLNPKNHQMEKHPKATNGTNVSNTNAGADVS